MSSLFKNISIYSIGDLLHKSIQFLLLPLYTNVLSPGDYGELELVYIIGSILVIVNGLLIQNAYSRFYFDSDNLEIRKKIFGTCIIFILFTSIIGLIVCFNLASQLSHFVFGDFNKMIYIKLICVSTIIGSICSLFSKNIIIRKKSIRFVTINIIDTIITLSVTIYFVLVAKTGVVGILQAQIIGRMTRLLMLFISTYSEIGFTFSISILNKMIYFSIFMIPSEVSSLIAYMSNRIFIKDYADLTQVGIFSLGYKIASITPILITGPVRRAFKPHIFSLIDNEKKLKREFSNFVRIYGIVVISFIFLLSIFAKEIIVLMADESYLTSYKIVFPLSIGYIFIGLSGLINTGLAVKKKTWVFGLAWIVCAIINLILNYILVPLYGIMGASIATIVSFLSVLIIYSYYLEKIYPISIAYIKLLYLLIVVIILYYISNLYFVNNILLTIFFKLFLVSLYGLFIFKANFLKINEKKYIINKIKGV